MAIKIAIDAAAGPGARGMVDTLLYRVFIFVHGSKVNLKYSPRSTVKPLHLFDHFKKLVKGQSNKCSAVKSTIT